MLLHFIALGILSMSGLAEAEPVKITLLHTNDLHSHFQEERTPFGLGGVARIKTIVDQVKKEIPNTLFLDGGDWSEGDIYYSLGAGEETVRMMDRLQYDVAVIGNHDFLNGPDSLLNNLSQVNPHIEFVAANLDARSYQRADDLKKWVKPYVIKELGGVKIAFIGMTTYEKIYDKFILPVRITDPNDDTEELARNLKKKVNLVVGISHNSIAANEKILRSAPSLDLIIGAHDHVKLTQPVVVNQGHGKKAWIVEAGSWGKYVGRVDLSYDGRKVNFDHYKLLQVDQNIPKDPNVLAAVEALETKIEAIRGPIFHDHIADSTIEFHRQGANSPIGNLVTDAYRKATQADFSMDVIKFIYGELHKGQIRTADVYNSNPAVYNPVTHKTWTLQVLPISGRVIKYFLNIAYSTKKLGDFSLVNVSGLTFKYDPLFSLRSSVANELSSTLIEPGMTPQAAIESFPMVQDIMIQGEPLDDYKIYNMATGMGVIHAIQYIDEHILNVISLEGLKDTGLETWRVMADYIHSQSPLTPERMPEVNRAQSLQADLGVSTEGIEWRPLKSNVSSTVAQIAIRVKNYGASPYIHQGEKRATLTLSSNKNGLDSSVDAAYQTLAEAQEIPDLWPGESKVFQWEVTVPRYNGIHGVTVQIHGAESEVNRSNDEATAWF